MGLPDSVDLGLEKGLDGEASDLRSNAWGSLEDFIEIGGENPGHPFTSGAEGMCQLEIQRHTLRNCGLNLNRKHHNRVTAELGNDPPCLSGGWRFWWGTTAGSNDQNRCQPQESSRYSSHYPQPSPKG